MHGNSIPEIHKKHLDSLFEAFSLVAEGTYVYLCDMRYDYSRWSSQAVETFGLPSEYMYEAGRIWEEHVHPEDRDEYRKGIEAIFSGKSDNHDMQYRARRADGSYDVCTCRGIVVCDEKGNLEYFGGAIRNHGIHGRVDALTGLKNKYSFFEDLKSYISSNTAVSILMLGIAGFTEVNELYGYRFGNKVLQIFGRYLLDNVGARGDVYRMDGTKFAIVDYSCKIDSLKAAYERLRIHCRQGVDVEGRTIVSELNAGLFNLVDFSADDQTVYSCLNFAYGESKVRRQGDLVEFYNNLNSENVQRIEKFQYIRTSVTRDFAGFYLLYQPYVDAHTEKIIGAEALIRWKNEEYGMVPPDHFIPLLERDPLFPKLGRWILETALTDAKRMIRINPDFIINVNLSYTQIERKEFTDLVLELINDLDFPPENLCLEITERCRLLDIALIRNTVVKLRSYGIKVALDDFGTGFSSMGIVRDVPLDTIKIDKSFIDRIETDPRERELIEHFTRFAGAFGAQVCVEGVEDAETRDILQKYNVHSFQGYYYSKPIEIDKLLEWKK
ncbi:MAG: EAL domain-containing protein [Lachnospiraceae bacterium]|nr:EAL domain-containing protein [Lachnospiraceae bacterium]